MKKPPPVLVASVFSAVMFAWSKSAKDNTTHGNKLRLIFMLQ